MRDFQNAVIYALTFDGRAFYIGSTTRTLTVRLQAHKDAYKEKKDVCPNRRIFNRFNEIGIENVKIELVSPFPCASYDDLLAEEKRHILLSETHVNGCNQRIAGGRPGSEHERYREHKLQKAKTYYQNLLARRAAATTAAAATATVEQTT